MSIQRRKFTTLIENKQLFKNVIEKSASAVSTNEYERAVYKTLMENTRHTLLESAGTMGLTDVEPVARVVLPLIKKLFPRLIANKIVSVQPMTGPTGFVRFLHYSYNGTQVPAEPSSGAPTNPYTPPIPSGLTDSYPVVADEQVATGDGTTNTFAHTTAVYPVAHNTVQVKVAGTVIATDGKVDAASSNTGILSGTYNSQPVYGTIDYLTGAIQLTTVSPVASGAQVTVSYNKDFSQASSTDMSTAEFTIENIPIFANTRKLRASWMPGALNALSSIDGVDMEKTLFNQVSNIIATEINMEIVNDLISQVPSDAVQTFYTEPPSSPTFYGTRTEWYEQLIVKINQVAATIANKIMVGEPNYLVVNPATAQLLRSAFTDFKISDAGVNNFGELSFINYGNLRGRYQVYVSPVVPLDTIFLGYKGPQPTDSGYVYAPWIPLKGQRYANDTGETGIVFYTAYGKKMYRSDFYGYINIVHSTPPAGWDLSL